MDIEKVSQHLKSIFVFGFLPSIFLLMAIGAGAYFFIDALESEKHKRRSDLETLRINRVQAEALEKYLKEEQRREKMAFLDTHLDEVLLQTLSNHLRDILHDFPENDIQNTAIGRPGGVSRIAGQSKNRYSRFSLVFEGHYQPILKTVTELEFRMPLITLESLNMKPVVRSRGSDEPPKIEIELNYLCWHRLQ